MRLFGSLLVLALLLCGSSGEVVIEHDMDGSMALKPSGARVEVEKGVVECDAVQLPKPTSNPTGGASDATISITGEDLKYLRDTLDALTDRATLLRTRLQHLQSLGGTVGQVTCLNGGTSLPPYTCD